MISGNGRTMDQTEIKTTTIAEQIRQIVNSEELSSTEKLDSLHALIPADVCQIDNLHQATPVELRRLQDGFAIAEAIQESRRRAEP